jgi:hypothetical protein
MSLIEMAIAFVMNHPAVTAAIIRPRTMEQLDSQLPAADVSLSGDVARSHRPDRHTRHQHQPRRRRLAKPRPGARGATAIDARRPAAQDGRRGDGRWPLLGRFTFPRAGKLGP